MHEIQNKYIFEETPIWISIVSCIAIRKHKCFVFDGKGFIYLP